MKIIKLFFTILLIWSLTCDAQVNTSSNGLTTSSSDVKLGGTLLNAQTAIDFGSGNTSSNFLIKKSTTNYFFIANGGSIGINTASPNSSVRMEIDNITAGSSGLRFTQLLNSSTAGAGNGKYLSVNSTGDVVLVNGGTVTSVGLSLPTGLTVSPAAITGSGTFAISTSLNGVMRANGSSGFTASAISLAGSDITGTLPISKGGSGLATLGSADQQLRVNAAATALEYFTPASTSAWNLTGNTGSNPTNDFIGTTDAQPLIFRANNSEAFRVSISGQVSIGTDNPFDYKLAVAGRMIAESVKVNAVNNWPDYVFCGDYKLMALSEIEKYILAEGHLPGVLTTEEVSKQGVDLGDQTSILLKKIEELTLHLIELNKKVDRLSAQNVRLGNQGHHPIK